MEWARHRAPNYVGAPGRVLKNNVSMTSLDKLLSNATSHSTKKAVFHSMVVPSPIPLPVFYDKEKPDMKIGTPEVRITNAPANNISSPTIYREQKNCEICHKKNRGEKCFSATDATAVMMNMYFTNMNTDKAIRIPYVLS